MSRVSRHLSKGVTRLGCLICLSAAVWLAAAAVARADYTASMCAGNPAEPWVNGFNAASPFAEATDACTSGDYFEFFLSSPTLQPGTSEGAGFGFPPGVVLTRAIVNYRTNDTVSGSPTILHIGYDGGLIVNADTGNDHGYYVDAGVPDGTNFFINLSCPYGGSACTEPSTGAITIGAIDLYLHDTGRPTVQATGGSLATAGTYAGTQTLIYQASDGGSGVDHVTVALGNTVMATAQNTCQTYNLQPCPPTTSGTLDVDTALVPDGTYPVILTAYDASGNPAPVQVATVTIRNHTGTQALPQPTTPRSVHTKVELTWHWTPASTVLTKLTIRKMARAATITVGCAGRRCPFKTRRGNGRHATRFVNAMERRVFHTGQKLTITIAQPHLTSERFRITIRRNRKPLAKAL